jgi:hypothetical protein
MQQGRGEADRRTVRLLAAVLLVPTALVMWQWWSDARTEARLTPVASAIASRDVEVDCQGLWASLLDAQGRQGEVLFDPSGVPESRIYLTHATCDRLWAFAGKRRHSELDCLASVDWRIASPLGSPCYRLSADTVYALLTLAHEAYHTAGVRAEAQTNCYAIQALAWTASALGADPSEAERIAVAMAALEPHQRGDYATNRCQGGTELDLHPETPDFPTEWPLAPPGVPTTLGALQ